MTRADTLERLASLVEKLRRECPWDREQTPDTIKTFLLEECYETLAAIDSGDPETLRGELGDLLFQIFFLSRLAAERGWFKLEDVARAITDKMTERHPHVFGDVAARDAQEVARGWEARKRRESRSESDPLGTIPASLPALAAAQRMTSRAADLGFDWEHDADVADKIVEELEEWRVAAGRGDTAAETRELGDLLLSVVNLARRRRIDPEAALRQTNARFRSRFAAVSRQAHASGREMSAIPLAELDAFWEEAKKEETAEEKGR
ncbi:MAG TPA: nucleoside triphosphate pyrophosphohydrolase [Thermoanaerobaculia bacterium]|nr:nucleoside triphosphate pyrophosphohydrolase [Thermoanaerobaculia bacterium]HTR03522.1 nucleoside triphosphate pyrophosphohydrolase [Thermoanaerobaculia bacterium]